MQVRIIFELFVRAGEEYGKLDTFLSIFGQIDSFFIL